MDYDALIAELASLLAVAIATAEGFYVAGSLPQRTNNPGDMKLGDRGYGVVEQKTAYQKADPNADLQDNTDGFSALRRECTAILTGASHVYSPSDTFEELSMKWTGGDNAGAWCKIVTEKINVQPLDRIVDWVKASASS
jgi:hypothetical protein